MILLQLSILLLLLILLTLLHVVVVVLVQLLLQLQGASPHHGSRVPVCHSTALLLAIQIPLLLLLLPCLCPPSCLLAC